MGHLMRHRRAGKVLLIGWDAADWQLISPLLDAGVMPCLNQLVNNGVKADLASQFPLLSPLLWTSIATGHRADRHGILGFTEPDPISGRLRQIGSTSRKVKAIWNILSQEGFRTHVVGWFASHPAEQINGVCVSELFAKAPTTPGAPWPLTPGSIHPIRLEEELAPLRLSMSDLVMDQFLTFVPRAAEIDQRRDPRLGMLAKCLANCTTVHAAGTWILEHEPWDFAAIFYDLLDHLGHIFMPFHPPRRDGIPEADFEMYREVMTGACRFLDMTLSRLLHIAGPDATVLLVSDHGFHCGDGRPTGLQLDSFESASAWHRPFGVFCASGPGIKRDDLIHGANILDVTPTVLALFGLPVGEDMAGRPLCECFDDPLPPEVIPSWEDIPGLGGKWPMDYQGDAWDARHVLSQLAELGYIQGPTADEDRQLQESRHHQQLNLARVHMAGRQFAEAIPLLEALHREVPDEPIYRLLLAMSHVALRQYETAENLISDLVRQNRPGAILLQVEICVRQSQLDQAFHWLAKAESLVGRTETVLIWTGRLHLLLNRPNEADAAFQAAIARNPQSALSQSGLALVQFQTKRYQAAAESALNAVGCRHVLPEAHFLLGASLARLGRLAHAQQALRVCLSQDPHHRGAQMLLERIQQAHRMRSHVPAPPLAPGPHPEEPWK